MPEQGQATELQIWMDKLREAAAKRDEPKRPEQEGDTCQNVSNSSPDRG